MRRQFLLSGLVAWLAFGCGGTAPEPETAAAPADEYFVYFGTYTNETSKGIYMSRFTPESGEISEPELAAEVRQPSFLALHPNRRFLYSVSETNDYDPETQGGEMTAFAIDAETGKLTKLNEVSSKGAIPCHLNVDQTGRTLVVANYIGGNVVSFPVQPDGSLGEAASIKQHEGSSVNPQRQRGPHAHSVDYSLDNKFVVACDLGIDKVMVYRVDPATAQLEPNDPPFATVNAGAGPRHFAFHPSASFAYAINELQSTVTAFAWDACKGALTELQTISTLPEDFDGENSTAEVAVHPSGKFLYGSNRGHNSIAVFSIDGASGKLTAVEHASTQGETPRNFAIHPRGQYLFAANQATDNVVLFRIDETTGKLKPTGKQVSVDAPVCILFLKR